MDILIIAQYLRDIENTENNSRFLYLADMLSSQHSVEIVTSDFNHGAKKHFSKTDALGRKYKITCIHEPGYKNNISFMRFFSHHKLAKNIKKYLRRRNIPNVLYCAIPSIDVADVAAKYCHKNNVRFIVDIQDLWPEAFKMVLRVPALGNIIFAPLNYQANRVYRLADDIVAVSQTYANRAISANPKKHSPVVAYLGTELEKFDAAKVPTIPDDVMRIAYIGSLSRSYDLTVVFDAIEIIQKRGKVKPIQFIIMGDGGLRTKFESYAVAKKIPATFTGMLEYPKMVELLCNCDIAVNPILSGSAGSIINKVGDYAMAGLPVINTQECLEYRNLLESYNAGINCENGNANSVADAIERLCANHLLMKEMSDNSRRMGEDLFDRKSGYKGIMDLIQNTPNSERLKEL